MIHSEFIRQLREWVRENSKIDSVLIKGLWHIDCIYKPSDAERKFIYQIVVAQTLAQGACYYAGPRIQPDHLISLVGTSYSCEQQTPAPVDIALLDSVANSVRQSTYIELYLSGPSSNKAVERARLIASEVNRLACTLPNSRRLKVCNVGVVSLLVRELIGEGFEVTATDMDTEIIGRTLFESTTVDASTETLRRVSESDIAVVTGMTLSTETLPQILEAAKLAGTHLIMFCETGAGCASFLIDQGVASVVSEPFPFYIYDGLTCIRVFRAPHL